MYYYFLFAIIWCLLHSTCNGTTNRSTNTTIAEKNEDAKIIQETISLFGNVVQYDFHGLPGPQLSEETYNKNGSNKLASNTPGNYVIKIRTITDHFSYNGRYEEGHIVKNGTNETPVIKGQFGEHFVRTSGGYYVRTIGYTLDGNGFKNFLVDLSIAEIKTMPVTVGLNGGDTDDDGQKSQISSTVITTLLGGNFG